MDFLGFGEAKRKLPLDARNEERCTGGAPHEANEMEEDTEKGRIHRQIWEH